VGHQPIEGAAVGGAQVDGGEHPQRAVESTATYPRKWCAESCNGRS
jgi:hypothetical protein